MSLKIKINKINNTFLKIKIEKFLITNYFLGDLGIINFFFSCIFYINCNLVFFEKNKLFLYMSYLKNFYFGVCYGFFNKLSLIGVGFKFWNLKKKYLLIDVGYSNFFLLALPGNIKFIIKKNILFLCSITKEIVFEFSNQVSSLKKLDSYKGKGIRSKKGIKLKKKRW